MKDIFLKAYDEHADALFRHCLFKINDKELAKDIVQETFTKTWLYIVKKNKIENIKGFLYKTLNNLIVDEYRKKKILSLDELDDKGFDPRADDLLLGEEVDGKIAMGLLKYLSDQYREVIFLRFVNGLEIHEIADITGESENNVSVRIHRGLKKLK